MMWKYFVICILECTYVSRYYFEKSSRRLIDQTISLISCVFSPPMACSSSLPPWLIELINRLLIFLGTQESQLFVLKLDSSSNSKVPVLQRPCDCYINIKIRRAGILKCKDMGFWRATLMKFERAGFFESKELVTWSQISWKWEEYRYGIKRAEILRMMKNLTKSLPP